VRRVASVAKNACTSCRRRPASVGRLGHRLQRRQSDLVAAALVAEQIAPAAGPPPRGRPAARPTAMEPVPATKRQAPSCPACPRPGAARPSLVNSSWPAQADAPGPLLEYRAFPTDGPRPARPRHAAVNHFAAPTERQANGGGDGVCQVKRRRRPRRRRRAGSTAPLHTATQDRAARVWRAAPRCACRRRRLPR